MLTPLERAWLDEQRTKLVQQTDEADTWSVQVLLLTGPKPSWWGRRSHARRVARAREMERLWHDRALRTDLRVITFLNVHNVLTGQARGPITNGGGMAAKTGGGKDDKAPNTGASSTTKRDDKASTTDASKNPGRPHVDR